MEGSPLPAHLVLVFKRRSRQIARSLSFDGSPKSGSVLEVPPLAIQLNKTGLEHHGAKQPAKIAA